MSDQGVSGNPTLFAPMSVFKTWNGKEPATPKGFVGIVKGEGIIAFHDPELTIVYSVDDGVVFVQQIAASTSLKRYVKKLPVSGWKPQPGAYTSDGGEHVLFDGMYPAADYGDRDQRDDIEAESGKPMRVKLAKGEYRLDVLGIWKPEDDTELVVARLVPSSQPFAKSEPTKPRTKKAVSTVAARKADPELQFVEGRFPPPLPEAVGEHARVLAWLHEQEEAMLTAKHAVDVWEKAWDRYVAKKKFAPAEVNAAVSLMAPIDLGKQPDNPDRGLVKGQSQWKQQDREFQALSTRRFVRQHLWFLIFGFLGRDPKLKRAWMQHAKETDPFYRSAMMQFLKQQ